MATAPVSTANLMNEPDLGVLLDDSLQPRPEALNKIYTAHHGHILRVCRRFFRRPEDAEDAAAEVILKLGAVLKQKDESHPFRPWVSQIAVRHCLDKLRKLRRQRNSCVEGMEVTELPDPSTKSPLAQVLQDEEHRRVRKLLGRLPEYYRVPLVLRYYKQMSYSEIALKLNRRLPAIKVIIFRAKNRLRRHLLESPS